jgi:hypothetical protein
MAITRWSIVAFAPLMALPLIASDISAQERPDPVEYYLEQRAARQQARQSVLDALGRAAALTEFRREVQGTQLTTRGPAFPVTAAARLRLQEALQEEVALYLTEIGMTPGEVRRRRVAGQDPIVAAAAALTASADLSQVGILSELVVLGEVVSVDSAATLGDGFHSSIRVRVVELLKGGQPEPTEVVVRLESGLVDDSTFQRTTAEVLPAIGERYVLFLSNSFYEPRARARGRAGRAERGPGYFVQQFAAYRVEGAIARATARVGSQPEVPLVELRDAMRVIGGVLQQ